MRIGTWNVENRLMTERHKELMLKQDPSRSNREANAGLVVLAGANDLVFDNSVCIASSPPAFRNRWHRDKHVSFLVCQSDVSRQFTPKDREQSGVGHWILQALCGRCRFTDRKFWRKDPAEFRFDLVFAIKMWASLGLSAAKYQK